MDAGLLHSAMTAVEWLQGGYWVCLIVGGGLVLLSLLGGGDDHGTGDFELDADGLGKLDLPDDAILDLPRGAAALDADTVFETAGDADRSTAGDVAHGPDPAAADGALSHLSQWLSLRFVVYFASMFGAAGVVLTSFTAFAPSAVLVVALVAGIAVGQFAHQFWRYVLRSGGNSAPRPEDYVRRLARVTVTLGPQRIGEVAVQVGRTQRFIPAVAVTTTDPLEKGTDVVVVAYRAGVAQVITRAAYEQRTTSQGESG
jgi:hypothetical protein